MSHYTSQKNYTFNQADMDQLEKFEDILALSEYSLQEGISLSSLGVSREIAFKPFLNGLGDIVEEIKMISDIFMRETAFDMFYIHMNNCNEKINQLNSTQF